VLDAELQRKDSAGSDDTLWLAASMIKGGGGPTLLQNSLLPGEITSVSNRSSVLQAAVSDMLAISF
jgi:hypothetical protein